MARHTDDHPGNVVCSFCAKGQEDGRKLVPGPTAFICEECITQCNDSVSEE